MKETIVVIAYGLLGFGQVAITNWIWDPGLSTDQVFFAGFVVGWITIVVGMTGDIIMNEIRELREEMHVSNNS